MPFHKKLIKALSGGKKGKSKPPKYDSKKRPLRDAFKKGE